MQDKTSHTGTTVGEPSRFPDRGSLLDCTLREGPYESHFDNPTVARITRALDSAGVAHIEVGAETGVGSRADVDDAAAVSAARQASPGLSVGVIAGIDTATPDQLRRIADAGAGFVRVAADAPRWRESLRMIENVRQLGLVATFNAIKCHTIGRLELAELSRVATNAGAEVIYLVDSAGTLLPADVARSVDIVLDAGARAGFHGHDNLALAVANSLAALAAGASVVDGTLRGIGRSAGNAQIEVLVAALRKQAGPQPIDHDELAAIATDVIAPLRRRDRGVDYLDMCMGEGGFHSEAFDLTRDIAAQYGVPLGPLLREAGRSGLAAIDEGAVVTAARAIRSREATSTPPPSALDE